MPQIEASFHSDNPYGKGALAVNVKVYSNFPKTRTLESWFRRIGYSEKQFEVLLEVEFENQQRNFWEVDVQEIGKRNHFDMVFSEGRSAGWAVPTIDGENLYEDNLTASILTNYFNFKKEVGEHIADADQKMYTELKSLWLDEEWAFLNEFVSVRWFNERKDRVLVPTPKLNRLMKGSDQVFIDLETFS